MSLIPFKGARRTLDKRLQNRLEKIREYIDALEPKEEAYLRLYVSRDAKRALLTQKQIGKSQAEREMKALSSDEWQQFCEALAIAETARNRV